MRRHTIIQFDFLCNPSNKCRANDVYATFPHLFAYGWGRAIGKRRAIRTSLHADTRGWGGAKPRPGYIWGAAIGYADTPRVLGAAIAARYAAHHTNITA